MNQRRRTVGGVDGVQRPGASIPGRCSIEVPLLLNASASKLFTVVPTVVIAPIWADAAVANSPIAIPKSKMFRAMFPP
jgi:hypothetical protein